MENTNITHKNLMHLNIKYQQWKYPINLICTTFTCMGFVGLKLEIVYFPYQVPFMGFCKISLCVHVHVRVDSVLFDLQIR